MSFVLNPPEPAHLIGVEGLEPAFPPYPLLTMLTFRSISSPRYRTDTHVYLQNRDAGIATRVAERLSKFYHDVREGRYSFESFCMDVEILCEDVGDFFSCF